MNPFRYAVSLRISHPTIDPSVITKTFQLQPKRASKKGEPRTTPTGESLEGVYEQTFWTHAYSVPQDSECGAFIHGAASGLQPHKQFFHRLRAEGGRAEFFIGWFGDKNFGETFPHATLSLLASLEIDLSFDVYPDATPVT